jgi:hypothetical protein
MSKQEFFDGVFNKNKQGLLEADEGPREPVVPANANAGDSTAGGDSARDAAEASAGGSEAEDDMYMTMAAEDEADPFGTKPKTVTVVDPDLLNETIEGRSSKRQLRVYRSLLRKAHVRKRNERLQRMHNFHEDDEPGPGWTPHSKDGKYLGRASEKLFNSIADARAFDKYGRMIRIKKHKHQTEMVDKLEAMMKDDVDEPSEQQNLMQSDAMTTVDGGLVEKKKISRTEELVIGFKPEKYGPPGMAPSVARVKNSENNERFYNYYGHWRHGKMHGQGEFTFADKQKYVGQWLEGRQHGFGECEYTNGSTYSGQWEKGCWCGDGTLDHRIGTFYEGQFSDGKKHGHGVQKYTSGQVYEGQWQCGVWHGRGIMTGSHYSPFQFRGCFYNGRIEGSGMLIFKTDHWLFPGGEFNQKAMRDLGIKNGKKIGWGVVREWPRCTFQELILRVVAEEVEYWEDKRYDLEELQQVLREEQLEEYVAEVRQGLADEKEAEKAEADAAYKQQMVEKRQAIKDARAAAMEESDEYYSDAEYYTSSSDDEKD